MIPEGADSVVRVEDTSLRDGRVTIAVEVEPGNNVRHAGDDIEPEATVLRRGARLGAAELGVLASVGVAEVVCVRRPRLGVLTTGDELQEPGDAPRPGGVRNSNAYTIPALALSSGAEVVATETVTDDPELTRAAIERMLGAEIAVICGGVSVGEHDHVKDALDSLGVEEIFWRVALKPGKPTWFGVGPGGTLVFGLPGNPVSAMVTFLLFVRPAILALLGVEERAGRTSAILDRGPTGGTRARPRRALLARASRRRLARPADREPGLARAHLDAWRRRTRDRARRQRCPRGRQPHRGRAPAGCRPRSIALMTVTVRLFAVFRERVGSDSIEVEVDDGATVAEALDRLAERPELSDLIERMPVRMAVNRDYADPDTPLSSGDELALVPPVSGGEQDRVHVRITDGPLSLESLAGLVSRPEAGAIVTFQGTTRDVSRLEYEAYREMAEERIAEILRECVEQHGLAAAAAEHRIGSVPLGESSVIVSVSAPHREEAFSGAREAIDRIKAEAPIWKREVDAAGSRWVEGTRPVSERRAEPHATLSTRAAPGWSTSAPRRRASAGRVARGRRADEA